MNGSQPGSDNDSSDSRKRPSDHDSDSGHTKRHNAGDNVHFKILVPSIAAGAIIGKGGEAIARIQKESGAKVKMSKATDYYRGTTERVCLILGNVEAIRVVHHFIMDRILEKPDPNPKTNSDGRLNVERHKQVKILVPNSTAGMIIGKAGSYISEIKDKSGAYIQISQKSKEVNLPERCVTIAGDTEQNRLAADMILEKIAEDPQSASCPNISYADVTGPVASAYPTGSPYAMSTTPPQGATGSSVPQSPLMVTGLASPPISLVHSPGSNFNLNASAGSSLLSPTSALLAGPMSPSQHPLMAAHAHHRLFEDSFGGAQASGYAPHHQAGPQSPTALTAAMLAGVLQPSHQDYQMAAIFGAAQAGASMDDRQGGQGSANTVTRSIHVSESLIGVVLGQQGRAIVELQSSTATNIQISKKGIYAPGTRDRTITISGSPTNVSRAAVLITQRVQNEEERRKQLASSGHFSPSNRLE